MSPTIRAKLTDTTFAISPVGGNPRHHYADVVLITSEGRCARICRDASVLDGSIAVVAARWPAGGLSLTAWRAGAKIGVVR